MRRLPPPRLPVADRFWHKVDRRGPDECWPWIGAPGTKGYGRFNPCDGRTVTASRFAYELTHGPLPKGEGVVRHTCDNPPCCNPRHLILGTHLDNEHDKITRGRSRKAVGEAVGTARLTASEVREIRRLYRPYKTTIPQLVKFYGVNAATIAAIVYGKSWRHL